MSGSRSLQDLENSISEKIEEQRQIETQTILELLY